MKDNISYTSNIDTNDLTLSLFGLEKCMAGTFFGPGFKECYWFIYIISGSGIFINNGKKYILHKNQGFLIRPGDLIFYEADHTNPWSYSWVGFTGIKVEQYMLKANITKANPIYNNTRNLMIENHVKKLLEIKDLTTSGTLMRLGVLYELISDLILSTDIDSKNETETKTTHYIKKALFYIENNYQSPLSIQDIADNIGLNRSYLGSIFKNSVKMSLQNYLTSYRIKKASELLSDHSLSIGEISHSVGYEDQLQFSKMFKKIRNISPTKYRELYK